MEEEKNLADCSSCSCVRRLEQLVYVLDSGVNYSQRVDGHSGLQEIAVVVKMLLQQQIKECEHCERNRRDPAEIKHSADDPYEIFRDHMPRGN